MESIYYIKNIKPGPYSSFKQKKSGEKNYIMAIYQSFKIYELNSKNND